MQESLISLYTEQETDELYQIWQKLEESDTVLDVFPLDI